MRSFLVLTVTAITGLAACSPAAGSPVAAKLFNQGISRIAHSPSIHAEVTLPGEQVIIVDHVASRGQRVHRLLGGNPIRTTTLLWSRELVAGQAPTLTGVFETRPSHPCWKTFGFASPYRMETAPFGGLQTAEERATMTPPRLTSSQVKMVKPRPEGVRRLRAQRGSVTAIMDVAEGSWMPVRLQVVESRITSVFSFPSQWEPSVPSPGC